MFSLFKRDPKAQLEKDYNKKLEQAMQTQRSGDIRGYSELSTEANSIYEQLQQLEKDA
ncbi:DUF6435 family protein [Porticoccus sp. GXU_MW_L64]